MPSSEHAQTEQIQLFLSPPHPCAYLDGQASQMVFFDPRSTPQPWIYQSALEAGFRRSGNHVYRPHCPRCHACVPVRIPVPHFRPNRSQRRCWRRNLSSLRIRTRSAQFDSEHFRLYREYTRQRHPDGGMAEADETRYLDFLTTHWCRTLFVEFRQDERLLAVAVTDVLPQALSAVYTFFEPQMSSLGLGVFAVLWQIEEARRRGLSHLYLGYWIAESEKMRYKEGYRPLEAWDGERWRRFEAGDPLLPAASGGLASERRRFSGARFSPIMAL
jgi:arginine-tRNA-protein transferase